MLHAYSLEQQIEARMHSQVVPGLALAIVKDQEILYARGFGMTSVEDGGIPVTSQTLFLIGSTAKPLTGTAIMRLVEAGKLDLDLPVKTYVDWLTFHQKGAEQRITLRMLLSHTAGLPSSSSYFGRSDPGGLEAYVREQIPIREFVAPPGKLYSYSNDGLVVAGYLAEVVSDQPFPDLMQALIFDPLEMKRTTYDPTVAMTYPLAQEHEWLEDGTVRVLHRFVNNTAYAPAGPQPMSTVLDLANFAIMHLNRGRFHDKQLLSTSSVENMQTNQVVFHTLKDEGYGLTFRAETYKGKHLVWHNGLSRATTSIFCLMPEEGIAVTMLFNGLFAGFGAPTIVYTLFDQLLHLSEKATEIQPIEAQKSRWSEYAGIYVSIGSGGLAAILLKEDHLVLDLNGTIIPLAALKQDFYIGRDPQTNAHIAVYFLPEEEGPTQYMTVDGRAYHRFGQDSSFVPRPTDWMRYVGTYTGNNGTIKIHIEGEHLLIHSVEDKQEENGIPLDQTRFVSAMGIIEFLHADDGTVSELLLHNAFHYPRVK